jgi:hypothetical protein
MVTPRDDGADSRVATGYQIKLYQDEPLHY